MEGRCIELWSEPGARWEAEREGQIVPNVDTAAGYGRERGFGEGFREERLGEASRISGTSFSNFSFQAHKERGEETYISYGGVRRHHDDIPQPVRL